jgi:hypothetical protein
MVATKGWALLGTRQSTFAHEVRPAALPAGAGQQRVDRLGEATVVVRDDELHTGEAALRKIGQEDPPGGLVLACEGVAAADLAVAVAVHGTRHDTGAAHDATGLAHPHGEGVEPEVGVGPAVERSGAEGGHLLVQALGHLRDRALRDALDAQGANEAVDTARGDALDVALSDHGHQGALSTAPALEQPVGVVAAAPELGHLQGDRAGAAVEGPLAVAVAAVHALR